MSLQVSILLTNLNFLPQSPLSQNVLDLILNSGLVAKIVLAILFLFSIISWAIVFDKLRVFRRLRKDSENFLRLFQMHKGLKDIFQASRQYSNNPFAAVFKEAYWLLSKKDRDYPNAAMTGSMEMLKEQRATPNHTPEDIVRLFDSVASREVLKLEKHLVFLATTGSVSPFYGLFGTVWGV
ncbi:MAG: MotA/TolQ/ExbB proton channel family protein, partial [bacterium]